MRILLIGEYSLLHSSLKAGLIELGHEVLLVGNKEGFRCYPVDLDYEDKILKQKIFIIPKKIIYRLFKFDLSGLERGIRFWFYLSKLKEYDVVQFVNEAAIKTTKKGELYFIKKITKANKKCFVVCAGIDYSTLKFYLENKNFKSILQPFFQNKKVYKEFIPFYSYFQKGHIKIHQFMMKNFQGLIAGDFDYVDAIKNNPIDLGLIPYPINYKKLKFEELIIEDKIVIFLGINKYTYNQKGICYFEKALAIIKKKYEEKVAIIVTNTIPYTEYLELYNSAHILLDQTFCCDQGYNALEAMAKGKVVFTGAEQQFRDFYKISDNVCINAKPDVDYLVNQLSYLIENPKEIVNIGKRARDFVEKEHDYIKIAQKYLTTWSRAGGI